MADSSKPHDHELPHDAPELSAQEAPDGAADKPSAWKTELIEWIKALVFAVVVVMAFKLLIAEPIRVSGPSMNDTLFSNQIMLVYKTGYMLGAPARQDVAVCHFPNSKDNYVKRIIGLPGETLEIVAGRVLIDGAALEEPYIVHPLTQNFGPVTLGEGEYFLMGDNRADSMDCRSVGPLHEKALVGKSVAVFWPLSDTHIIRHE